MPVNDRIDAARELAAHGQFRPAVDLLRNVITQEPNQDPPRIALAELYRSWGYPDQAGRWGAVISGWATDREMVLFARSFHPDVPIERIASVLRTETERVPPELVALVRASGRARPGADEKTTRETVAAYVAALAVLTLSVGSFVVLVGAVVGFADTTRWAQIVVSSFGFLGVLASAMWLISAVRKRLWRSAFVSLLIALALFLLACWLVAEQIAG